MRATRAGRLGAAVLVAVALVACGGSSGGSSSTTTTIAGRALTTRQAAMLAQVFLENYRGGGASFAVSLPARGQVVARLQGEVDWKAHLARATFEPTGAGAKPTEYVWSRTIVLDGGITGLQAAMQAKGRDGVTWISRPLDPTFAPIDSVFALLLTISSDRADNPELLAQSGARYLGRRSVDGVALDEYRYGENTTYLIGVGDHRVHRLTARFRSYSDPVVIDLADFGTRRIPSPQKSTVVDSSTIPDIYKRLTGHSAPTGASPPPTTRPSVTGG